MSLEQRRTLEAWIRAHNTSQGIALRAKIALLAADGLSNVRVAREEGGRRLDNSIFGFFSQGRVCQRYP